MSFVRVLRRCVGQRHCRAFFATAATLVFGTVARAEADAPPHIVVTATPLAMMVADITRGVTEPETIDLAKLAKLSPQDMRKALGSAKLVVWVGPFHLPRLTPVLSGQRKINSLPLFDVRGVRLMGLPEPVMPGVKPDPPQIKIEKNKAVAARRREISAKDLHHKYPDPYIWLDPRNGIAMVRAITTRLSAIDPAHGRLYRRNGAALISQLEALDQEVQMRVVPLRKDSFVSLDRSFQYFERQYDLEPKLRLHESNTPMTATEAGAAHRKLAASRIDCVIVPTTAAHAKAVVNGIKVRVAWIDPYGRDLHRDTRYAAFLTSVAERFATCLTGRRPPSR